MILISKYITPKWCLGITLYPFVFLRDSALKSDRVLINHERIHLKQQLELLVLPFYTWYGIEFLVRLIQYKDRHTAYRNISFEREAYAKEKDLNYLKLRSWFSFLKYL
ncbi:hypothetical protein [uncultured Formosa sp.]|uniref:hypothetical protein n=1 Tax=uncultured Formosa sp. TaxID=255435 RepID=UPI00263A0913|nr:hypothetical protein [uncultured Formosa sp.]